MKTHKNILIEKACSGDSTRPMLASVYLDKDSSRIVATNGRIAAIVPVECYAGDASGYITSDTLKAARKTGDIDGSVTFEANGICKMSDGQEFVRPDLGKYPNIDGVIPKDKEVFTASLDPELLYAVAQAIGASRGVTLEFCSDGKAIRVRPCDNPRAEGTKGAHVGYLPACANALGLIMPIRLSV